MLMQMSGFKNIYVFFFLNLKIQVCRTELFYLKFLFARSTFQFYVLLMYHPQTKLPRDRLFLGSASLWEWVPT